MTGKVYLPDSAEGAKLLVNLQERTNNQVLFNRAKREFEGFEESPQAGYGTPALVAPRLGQGAFRLLIAHLYDYKCAVTDTRVLPALDSAHIMPFARGGDHSVSNGLLLRKDVHAVFDEGFATIDANGKFAVSNRVRTVFNNGHEYLRLQGKPLAVPTHVDHRPASALLQWHRDNIFLGD